MLILVLNKNQGSRGLKASSAPNRSQLKQVIMKTASKVANIPIWRNTSLEDLEGEIWKPIKGYEGFYEVSSLGRVKSLEKTVPLLNSFRSYPEKIILQNKYKLTGYLYISLCKNGKIATRLAHRLACIAFHDNPKNKPQVNHKNGIKSDNRALNIEWNTRSENQKHSVLNGLRTAKGEKNSQSKLNDKKVLEIRQKLKEGLSGVELSSIYNISKTTISNIKSRNTWNHL